MSRRSYNDPTWDGFRDILKAYMEEPSRVTVATLADALGVPSSVVGDWRKGRSRPRLSQLPDIVAAISRLRDETDWDPSFLLRRMGVLPASPSQEELFSTAYRLQKVELRLADAQSRLSAFAGTFAAATIVSAAVESEKWAVAVWPTFDGPPDCRLHVADRVDIRRLDGAEIRADEVWDDPFLKPALRSVYAMPSSARPRWTGSGGRSVQEWTVRHVGSPRAAIVSSPWPQLRSIGVYAITVDSWVHAVASMVAMLLGYGFTATPDLAFEGLGSLIPSRARDRDHLHAQLCRKPPRRRVWSHHGESAGLEAFRVSDPVGHFAVYLRETDSFLAAKAESAEQLSHLRDLRDRADHILSRSLAGRTCILDVDLDDADNAWTRALLNLRGVLTGLTDSGVAPTAKSLDGVHKRLRLEAGVGDRLLDWFVAGHVPWPDLRGTTQLALD